jgi:hypothetical protein
MVFEEIMVKITLRMICVAFTLCSAFQPLTAGTVTPENELPFKAIHFEVRDMKSGKQISHGTETINRVGDTISKETIYWLGSDKNSIIQREEATFALATLRPKNYRFENVQSGEFVSLTAAASNSDDVVIHYRPATGAKEETTQILWNSDLILGKTLHHVIVRAWDSLLKGAPWTFPLFVPMKRDKYNFRVISRSKPSAPDSLTTISLEIDQWALRQLAPEMLFMYRKISGVPRLERYEGPTTVNVDNNPDRKVIIEFKYES